MSAIEKVEKIELTDVLPLVFLDILKNKEQIRKIDEILSDEHNVPRGTLNELLISEDMVSRISETELAAIVVVLYNMTQDERINPEDFYTEKEINKAKKYKKRLAGEVGYPYTFKNKVLQVSDQRFLMTMTYQEIASIWGNILKYNDRIQRKPTEKMNKKSGEMIRKPKLVEKSIKAIVKLMEENRFDSNSMVFNLLMDGEDSLQYNDGELTVLSGEMDVIDGAHRLFAVLRIVEMYPDYKGEMDIKFLNLPYDEARFFLGCINKMSKFDQGFVKVLMSLDTSDKVITSLEKNSALRGRLTENANVGKKMPYLTNYAILSKATNEMFKLENNKDRLDVTEVLTTFFDYLIDYYETTFNKNIFILNKARDLNLMNYHNTFVGYIVIASRLFDKYGKKIPTDEIVRIVDNIDFNRDSEYGRIIETAKSVNSNDVKKAIRKYFEMKTDELLNQ